MLYNEVKIGLICASSKCLRISLINFYNQHNLEKLRNDSHGEFEEDANFFYFLRFFHMTLWKYLKKN